MWPSEGPHPPLLTLEPEETTFLFAMEARSEKFAVSEKYPGYVPVPKFMGFPISNVPFTVLSIHALCSALLKSVK